MTRTVTLDTAYTTTDGYDGYGRPLSEAYQRGAITRTYTHAYNAMGMDARLSNEAGTVLWQETAQDAFAREIAAVEGAMALKVSYDPHTANRTSATWSVAASNQERYSETQNVYDVLNNLKQRTGRWNYNDPNPAVVQRSYQDAFTYDPMNRLWTAQAWSQPPETFTYDAIGNITSKTSVASGGLYTYPTSGAGSVGPHAVKSIAGLGAYAYDLNGNMRTAPNATSATWTSFDMPLVMSKAANSDTFVYGPEHQRISQLRAGGNTLYYEGSLEVEVSASGTTVKTYWPNGRGVTIDGPSSSQLLWTPSDKLGNVRGYLDASGNVVEMLDYDAWGKRRNPSGIGIPDSLSDAVDNKGFTGHEMLDSVGLVHMNGRIYDPLVGRFLSADPTVQSPEDSQSYNRYSYVWNNPTNLTDPTGFFACPPESVCEVTHRDFTSAAMGAKVTTTITSDNGSQPTETSTSNSRTDATVSQSRSQSGNAKDAKDAASKGGGSGQSLEEQRQAMLNSPNPSVAHMAGCVGNEGGCAAAAVAPLGVAAAVSGTTALVATMTPQAIVVDGTAIYGSQQILRNTGLIQEIKDAMQAGVYRFQSIEGRIGGEVTEAGEYIVGEGHKRMSAAIQIFKETGNSEFVKRLIEFGRWGPNNSLTPTTLPTVAVPAAAAAQH